MISQVLGGEYFNYRAWLGHFHGAMETTGIMFYRTACNVDQQPN